MVLRAATNVPNVAVTVDPVLVDKAADVGVIEIFFAPRGLGVTSSSTSANEAFAVPLNTSRYIR